MNDRYLYRAKRMGNEEWVQGYLFDDGLPIPKRIFVGGLIIDKYNGTSDDKWNVNGIGFDEIYPSTICQCTGLKDKNGKLIYENDIIACKGIITHVFWSEKYGSWALTRKGWMYNHFFGESQNPEECEIIGNIFDNLDMLEAE